MKFGSWTYDGLRLDLVPEGHPGKCIGDIKKFIRHGEWDLTNMPCNRNELVYACCPEPYPDITYTMELRRRHMFYFVNLIAPCFLISGPSEFSRAQAIFLATCLAVLNDRNCIESLPSITCPEMNKSRKLYKSVLLSATVTAIKNAARHIHFQACLTTQRFMQLVLNGATKLRDKLQEKNA